MFVTEQNLESRPKTIIRLDQSQRLPAPVYIYAREEGSPQEILLAWISDQGTIQLANHTESEVSRLKNMGFIMRNNRVKTFFGEQELKGAEA